MALLTGHRPAAFVVVNLLLGLLETAEDIKQIPLMQDNHRRKPRNHQHVIDKDGCPRIHPKASDGRDITYQVLCRARTNTDGKKWFLPENVR